MKKYIAIIILFLAAVPGIKAQTFSDDNYIYTAAPKKKVQVSNYNTLTKDDITQSVTYFDGLGRPVQTTAINQGDTNGVAIDMDIITPVEYDGFGRQIKEYLPYPLTNSTTSYSKIAAASSITTLNGVYNTAKYENTTNPFSEKRLELSPLNRVLEQAAPGNDWALSNTKKNTIKLDYQTNISSDAVRLYKATVTWQAAQGLYDIAFSDAGTYAQYELYKTITYDENSGVNPDETAGSTVEFKNKEGQVILKRTYDAAVKHDTYYVYDMRGNLTYVLPPKADASITQAVLDGLCYQYKYDYRNRLVEKKLPGKQWEFIVYDRLDRPVATGPAFSPFSNDASVGWIITKYDVFGRPIYTGWYTQAAVSPSTRKTLQDAQNLATTLFETKTALPIDGIATNYNNSIAPKSFKLLTVNYYDDYSFPGAQAVPATIISQTVLTNAKGLPTGSWTRTLTTPSSVAGETSTIFYDEYGRAISTYTKNHLTGISHTDNELDFSGKTLSSITEHQRLLGDPKTIINEKFTYSAQDRLVTHTHQIGNAGIVQLMAYNTYDNLGQLMSKKVGNTTGSPLQVVDYNYNIRGWLTEINKTANLQQGGDPRDLFAFKINYNKVEGNSGFAKALYNGNIAETFWSSGLDGPNISRGYGYQYDQLNRLKNASYQAPLLADNKNYFGESMEYDKNGNIIKLQRKYMAGTSLNPYADDLDNLGYFYKINSNQLMKVTDASNIAGGFKDDSNGANDTADDYDYDFNGNLIKDDNKGITIIDYNHLNLPKKITFGTKGSIEYIYNAAGQKVQKIVSETSKPTLSTDYLGGFQYKGNVLEFFPTAEGYVKNTGGLSYVFQYKDHLGNVRANYTKNPATQVLEIIDENNYYPFGLTHVSFMNVPQSNNKYKYNGKELQDESIGGNQLNLYDYGARNYDPALGRWMNIDPLAEKYFHASTYAYVCNDPVNFIDPDGMDRYYMNGEGKTVLALKEDKEDMLFIGDKNNENIVDVNKDGKQDSNDGLKVKSKGLLSQLTNYRSGSEKSGTKYVSSIGEQSKQHEEDYLNIFKFASDNTSGAEFSLTFYQDRGKEWIEFATYNNEKRSPSPDGLGTGIDYSKVRWHAHNHPSGYASEMSSMGYINENEMYNPSDARNAVEHKRNYPNYVYFPESKKLYNVSMYGIQFIKKINKSKDLK
ncbi:RHS repeat-associated protein [Flavobacterium sp. 9]|uniref:DUF6443 domain-containing protein n=1 Tax=Flavobacterium sp. 9 TaxID=2035198 RepID=UPI000C4EE454|nr:DUF6443 domain-containing protein [Flavobacterium sp. 9]PIF33170.1 RHS repeat-associated protein [Flavobacterium sp. 9]